MDDVQKQIALKVSKHLHGGSKKARFYLAGLLHTMSVKELPEEMKDFVRDLNSQKQLLSSNGKTVTAIRTGKGGCYECEDSYQRCSKVFGAKPLSFALHVKFRFYKETC